MTQVSKANPTIKKIIGAMDVAMNRDKWAGRLVSVDQVGPTWGYSIFNDSGEPYVFRATAGGTMLHRYPRPSYGGPATQVPPPSDGEIVVVRNIGRTGSVTIYIPRLDPVTLEVVRDAIISGNKRDAKSTAYQLGAYGGIALAIAESEAKTLGQAEAGKSSTQINREVNAILDRNR